MAKGGIEIVGTMAVWVHGEQPLQKRDTRGIPDMLQDPSHPNHFKLFHFWDIVMGDYVGILMDYIVSGGLSFVGFFQQDVHGSVTRRFLVEDFFGRGGKLLLGGKEEKNCG